MKDDDERFFALRDTHLIITYRKQDLRRERDKGHPENAENGPERLVLRYFICERLDLHVFVFLKRSVAVRRPAAGGTNE